MPLSPNEASCSIMHQAREILYVSSHVQPTWSIRVNPFLPLHDSALTSLPVTAVAKLFSLAGNGWCYSHWHNPGTIRRTGRHPPPPTPTILWLSLSLFLCLSVSLPVFLSLTVCFSLALPPPSLNYTHIKCFFLPSLLCSTFPMHVPLSVSEVCSRWHNN